MEKTQKLDMTDILKIEIRDDTEYTYHANGFLVIKPVNYKPSIPAFCPVCGFIMNNAEDDRSYIDFQCCASCVFKWVQPDRKKWSTGWRPCKKDIKKYQKERDSMPISFSLENT